MTEHLPECIYAPEEFDFEQNIVWGGKPCICDRLRACEQRVREDQTGRCVAAFHDRISDSDLDDLLSDDEKDIVAQSIRSARQRQ